MTTAETAEQTYRPAPANPGRQWGWFVALGVLFIIFGAIALANVFLATVVSVYVVGILLLAGGIMQVVHSFSVRTWGGFFFWLISGILYAIAGGIAFYNPALTATVLTLMLAIMLIASGIFRIVAGFQYRPLPGWGWLVASGVVTSLAGLVFLLGWPVNSLYLLGLILAFDLLFQGASAIALGFSLRRLK